MLEDEEGGQQEEVLAERERFTDSRPETAAERVSAADRVIGAPIRHDDTAINQADSLGREHADSDPIAIVLESLKDIVSLTATRTKVALVAKIAINMYAADRSTDSRYAGTTKFVESYIPVAVKFLDAVEAAVSAGVVAET